MRNISENGLTGNAGYAKKGVTETQNEDREYDLRKMD